ncbi:MAG: GatB/YqeY domain-containing protein [Rhodobacteraceae bacterium]|nr:MAG: GatB/YqeY domain-containing protein [Paracoccaceae bacterium]
MSLQDKITTELKAAMRAKDATRLATLRLISAAIKDREIAARGDQGVSALTEADLITVLTRMVKQRRDSARAYEEAARLDLAEKEIAEIGVIESFLPRQLTEAEMTAAIDAVIAETGAKSVRDIGAVMAALKARFGGQMDFGKAGAAVKARLA